MKRALLVTAISSFALTATVTSAGEVVWWTPNWGQARAEKAAADFEAANPGIKIRLEITTSKGLPERVATALQSGSAPDIIEVQHGWVNGYYQSGLLTSLDDVIPDKSDFNQAVLNLVTFDGEAMAIPYRIECPGVLYNMDDFTAAGLDANKPPETWDQWVKTAKALTKDGKFGMAITGGGEVGNTVTRSMPLVWMNGGNIISDDGKTATINSPAAVEAIKFYTDFYRNGYSPDSTLQNDGTANRQLFIAGKVSMFQSGSYDLAPISKGNPAIKVGIMPPPHPEGKSTSCVLGGWSYVVPSGAKNPEEAKKFLAFMNTTEMQGAFTDTFPARLSSLKVPRYDDPQLKQFIAFLETGRPYPVNVHWVQIAQALFDGIQRILSGEQDAQAAMDEANAEIQALLDS